MIMSKRHFEFGKLIGGADSEMNGSAIRAMEGYTAVMDSPEAEPLKRNMCKLAALAFEVDGAEKSAHAILFRNLAKAPKWYPEFNRFTDCVTRALAKQASPLVPAAAVAANDKLGGLVSKLLALGTLGGIGAGGLGFLMSRDARQTSAENAALLEKIRAYRQLRRDLEEDMAGKQIMPEAKSSKPQRYDV
jgi:hypothetical protein